MTILINLKQALKAVSFPKGIIFPDEDNKKLTLNLWLPPKVLIRIIVSKQRNKFFKKDMHEVKYHPSCWGLDQLDMEKGTAKDLNLGTQNESTITRLWLQQPYHTIVLPSYRCLKLEWQMLHHQYQLIMSGGTALVYNYFILNCNTLFPTAIVFPSGLQQIFIFSPLVFTTDTHLVAVN